jgi:hypothetical protein
VDRAVHTNLRGLHWVELIVYWRSRAGQIENLINFYIQRKTDIVPGQLESGIRQQMMHVVSSSSVKIIDTQNFVAARQQAIA